MRKTNIIIILLVTVILSGCYSEGTTIDYSQPEEETTTLTPVNEEQCYSSFTQINITELEGFSDVTEADIFLPIPNDAIWDAESKICIMPDNLVNKNGESFIMTISLEQLPEGANFETQAQAAQEEVERVKSSDRKRYSGSNYITDENVVIKYIKTVDLEKASEENQSTEPMKKITRLSVVAYDFLEPTYYLEMELEIIKLQGTVDDTTDSYISAIGVALEKFKYHYQED